MVRINNGGGITKSHYFSILLSKLLRIIQSSACASTHSILNNDSLYLAYKPTPPPYATALYLSKNQAQIFDL